MTTPFSPGEIYWVSYVSHSCGETIVVGWVGLVVHY